MAVLEAPETSASRKKMRFTIPPPHPSIDFRGEIEGNYGNKHDHWGDNSEEEESQRDQEPSESDGDDEEGQDEEVEQVDEESQRDQEPSESDGDDEEGEDEEDEQVDQERQSDQEPSESDGDEEEGHDIEEEQGQEESQSYPQPLESDGDDEEGQDIVDEQGEESQSTQVPLESTGDDEEGQDEEDEQGEDVSEGGGFHKGSSEPALAPLSKRTVIANMTLDEDMLDCGVCCLPLKPPIFQCDVGHVVCSSCRDKLAAAGRCHVCRAFGYRRCHAMEQLVESIRGSCPNMAYGCTVRMAYYDLHAHFRTCPHAPCRCPAEACGFVGSTTALLDHFIGVHKWPCTTGVQVRERLVTNLHDGFNVVAVVRDASQYLFLLSVVRTPFGRMISSFCLHAQAAIDDSLPLPSKNVKCGIHLFYWRDIFKGGDLLGHLQDSTFKVACTDLSNGVPNPHDCFQFIVPNSVQPEAEATVKVTAYFIIE